MVTNWPDDFRQELPHRPLDWRFKLASQIAAGSLPPHLEQFVDDNVRAVAVALVGGQANPAAA